jgi:hypothetical protein
MLKAYLDSSGKRRDQYITLVAIVASEANWPEFENHWISVLKSYSRREFHMTEHQFKRWSDEPSIVKDMLNVLGKFPGPEFLIKSCTVEMKGYQTAKKENPHLRRAEAICVNFCCGTGLPPDKTDPDSPYPKVELYFDRNEPYLDTLYSNWLKRRKHQGWPSQIQQIKSVKACDCPGVQAADLVAWIWNAFHRDDSIARCFFPIFLDLLGGMHKFYDYELIKRDYGNDKPGADPLAYKALDNR